MWVADFLDAAEAVGISIEPSDEQQVEAVTVLLGGVDVRWCPDCMRFRTGTDCQVCKATKTLEDYREETAALADGNEELLPQPREHQDPTLPRLPRLRDPKSEDLIAVIEEAWELKRIALAYDRAKKERRALRRRLDSGREGKEGTSA